MGFTHINEGHLSGHRRDDFGALLWVRTCLFDPRLVLAAGAGGAYYFDTKTTPEGAHTNEHGIALILSLGTSWYWDEHWSLQFRQNWMKTSSRNIDLSASLLGIGYRFGPQPGTPRPGTAAGRNQITVSAGAATVNSLESERSLAFGIEYRRRLTDYSELTFSLLDEGGNSMTNRKGTALQLWAARRLSGERISLGMGIGPYYASDSKLNKREWSFLVSITGAYRFHPAWGVRLSFDRVITDYDRDADIIHLGIGYWF